MVESGWCRDSIGKSLTFKNTLFHLRLQTVILVAEAVLLESRLHVDVYKRQVHNLFTVLDVRVFYGKRILATVERTIIYF